jgi:hypothetical protein
VAADYPVIIAGRLTNCTRRLAGTVTWKPSKIYDCLRVSVTLGSRNQ